jgi:hypothetical protein
VNGWQFALTLFMGGVAGATWQRLRKGGVLDLETCLSVGHRKPDRQGQCPRCTRRVLMVAP